MSGMILDRVSNTIIQHAHASFYPGQDLHHMAVCLMFRSCMFRLCLTACCVGTSGRAGGEVVTKAELSGQVPWDNVIVLFSCYNTANVMGIFNLAYKFRGGKPI
jgi:hypothetical protein